MSTSINAKTLELITSKVLHDLISPIGAINNGVEIFQEMGDDAGEEVIDLIASSAAIASAKLKAYRIAYGAGGADANLKPADAHQAFADILEHEKRVTQDWDPGAPLFDGEESPTGLTKILVAFLLLALECLPRGGVVSVKKSDDQENTIVIQAEGNAPLLKEGFEDCLRQNASLEDLSPALTHAFMTGFIALNYGFSLNSINHTDTSLQLKVALPKI